MENTPDYKKYEVLLFLKPVDHINLHQAILAGAKFDDLIDAIGKELKTGSSIHEAVYQVIKNVVNDLGVSIILKDDEWIPVEEKMPKNGIRVWASTGPLDVGRDCYFGKKGCTFGEAIEKGLFDHGKDCWRVTETQLSAERLETKSDKEIKITHWRELPNSPNHVITPLFPGIKK